MAKLATTRNFVDQNIKNNTFLINGEHKADGIDLIEYEADNDRYTVNTVADGMGTFSTNPSTSGVFRLNLHKSSATNTFLWGVYNGDNDNIEINWRNTAMPDFFVTCKVAKIAKPPMMSEQLEGQLVEWEFRAVYVKYSGAGFAEVTA